VKNAVTDITHRIAKRAGKAINDYQMIGSGDRVLVAVSGGKDSLTLLTVLRERKKWVPIDYSLLAVYIESDYDREASKHRKVIEGFLRENDYQYRIDKISLKTDEANNDEINCFWCSWNRRKRLFQMAEEYNCNKLALGHHRDDVVQTMLLNLFYQGEISTMPPQVSMFGGKLSIVRPLVYIDEKDISQFARERRFPVTKEKCPRGITSQRARIKEILAMLEKECPQIKNNIFGSMKRIKKDYLV